MKLKKFNEGEDWDYLDSFDDEYIDPDSLSNEEEEEEEEEEEDDFGDVVFNKNLEEEEEQDEVIKELCYLLRKMLTNYGIKNFYMSSKGYDISMQFVLNKSEQMKNLVNLSTIIKKISDDVLIQYESEVDLLETSEKYPVLVVDFYYDANKSGRKNIAPF